VKDLSQTITEGLAVCYRDFGVRVNELSEGLSEERFWQRPYPYGNSVGNLVLHLTGNLNYYIGTQIAGTGYTRERDREFSWDQSKSKAEALRGLDDAIAVVVSSLEAETQESWKEPYEAALISDVRSRFHLYLRCASHFHHHIGQMTYLIKELARNS